MCLTKLAISSLPVWTDDLAQRSRRSGHAGGLRSCEWHACSLDSERINQEGALDLP